MVERTDLWREEKHKDKFLDREGEATVPAQASWRILVAQVPRMKHRRDGWLTGRPWAGWCCEKKPLLGLHLWSCKRNCLQGEGRKCTFIGSSGWRLAAAPQEKSQIGREESAAEDRPYYNPRLYYSYTSKCSERHWENRFSICQGIDQILVSRVIIKITLQYCWILFNVSSRNQWLHVHLSTT